jgi:hypothetical protein
VDQPTRKARSVWNFFLQPDGDVDVSESHVDQGNRKEFGGDPGRIVFSASTRKPD